MTIKYKTLGPEAQVEVKKQVLEQLERQHLTYSLQPMKNDEYQKGLEKQIADLQKELGL